MQFNLSLVYSIILTVLFSIMNTGNSIAASIDSDSMETAKVVNTRFPVVSIRADNSEGVDPAASLTHKPADGGSHPAGSIAVDNIRSYPVPEPASMLLVGSGLIVLAGTGRKKFLKKKYR